MSDALHPRARWPVILALLFIIKPFVTDESPFNIQRRGLRPGGWNDTVGVDLRLQVPFDDAVGLVDDIRGDRMPLQDISKSFVDRTVGRS